MRRIFPTSHELASLQTLSRQLATFFFVVFCLPHPPFRRMHALSDALPRLAYKTLVSSRLPLYIPIKPRGGTGNAVKACLGHGHCLAKVSPGSREQMEVMERNPSTFFLGQMQEPSQSSEPGARLHDIMVFCLPYCCYWQYL